MIGETATFGGGFVEVDPARPGGLTIPEECAEFAGTDRESFFAQSF